MVSSPHHHDWGLCVVQIRGKLRSLEGLLQFRGNEQEISHTAHKLSVGAFALQSALDKVSTLQHCLLARLCVGFVYT